MTAPGQERRLTVSASLPVYRDKQTISEPVGMSQGANRYRNGLSVSLPPITSRWRRYFAFAPRNGTRFDHIGSIGALWQVDCWRLAPSAP